ncbi:hypothetical protein LG634_04095 [Streptomyces bambusae]|uniref:SCO6745 family protein n=1 Tax=Streptomyces bambusae TaxID=1550616 RepID=UPI001CFF2C9D|nr:hypothetical protein [Streptomyces bambusae]MCB5164017.1 hypothetical protein [Streptomyces bambusae]
MTSLLPARAVRNCGEGTMNTTHAVVIFAPEHEAELKAVGITERIRGILAVRAAALGPIGPGAAAGAFFNHNYAFLAEHFPAVWEQASPADVLAARARAAEAALPRLFGADVTGSPEMKEAAALALRATEACERPGKTLFAAHADLPVPEVPHVAYWHAATLLREHRGDGHVAALLAAGLDPVESMVAHSASGTGISGQRIRDTRGWTQEDLEAAKERLRERGLLDAAGDLTQAGADLREAVEVETDRLDRAPYEHLGAAGTARLTELGQAWFRIALGNGGFPADLFGKA